MMYWVRTNLSFVAYVKVVGSLYEVQRWLALLSKGGLEVGLLEGGGRTLLLRRWCARGSVLMT